MKTRDQAPGNRDQADLEQFEQIGGQWSSGSGATDSSRLLAGYRFCGCIGLPGYQRHPESETGAFSGRAFDLDAPAVRDQDGAGNGQSHACALAPARAAPAAVELLEDQRQVKGVDARAVVLDGRS